VNRSTLGAPAARIACLVAVAVGSTLATVGCQTNTATGEQQILLDNSRKQGITLYKAGNYTDAVGAFQNAVRTDPRDYQSLYYLGMSYDALKSYQQAIGAFNSSLDMIQRDRQGKLDKSFRTKILDGLASSIAKSDNREREIATIVSRATARENAQDWMILAKTYRNMGDADAAMDAYNRANKLEPRNFIIAKDYGLYLEGTGQNAKAEAMLKTAYRLDPDDAQVNDGLRRLGIVPGPSLNYTGTAATPRD
jgi:tetratricopeptide (TPR) repeat protein